MYGDAMTRYVPASALTNGQAIKRLATLTNNLRDAQCDLEDLLLELHADEERWEQLTYAQLASAMGVSRQAVQQRVLRLIEGGRRRQAGLSPIDPNQLTLDDTDVAGAGWKR